MLNDRNRDQSDTVLLFSIVFFPLGHVELLHCQQISQIPALVNEKIIQPGKIVKKTSYFK